MLKGKEQTAIEKLVEDFNQTGYFGTEYHHQVWLGQVLAHMAKQDQRIAQLEAEVKRLYMSQG